VAIIEQGGKIMSTKIIVSNFTALKQKYGAGGVKKIQAALNKLISADKKKGLQTTVFDLADVSAIKKCKGNAVTNSIHPKQNKDAIDAVYKASVPDYLMILGAIDVIPYQKMTSPLKGTQDNDKHVPSDLPYACEAEYSTNIANFIGPTRVIGRVPDIVGDTSEKHLCDLLNAVSQWTAREKEEFENYFSVSADTWKSSTGSSVKRIFGNDKGLNLSPLQGPNWTDAQFGARSHFINCHGAEASAYYYGQKGSSYPIAHKAELVGGKISEGTIVAAECCYGAELFDPRFSDGQPCMANTYLGSSAYGFWGSTCIAYGPAAGNGQADDICRYFMQEVLEGASIGRSALTAWQTYARNAGTLDPVDLKTLGQFYLLGDPSVHPVKTGEEVTNLSAPVMAKSLVKEAHMFLSGRVNRRHQLLLSGNAISALTGLAVKTRKAIRSASIDKALEKIMKGEGMNLKSIETFTVRGPSPSLMKISMKSAPLREMKQKVQKIAYHVMSDSESTDKNLPDNISLIVAMEENSQIVSYKRLYSR
jgi:hypothetical protein